MSLCSVNERPQLLGKLPMAKFSFVSRHLHCDRTEPLFIALQVRL
jgi:hypothetical protein